MIGLRTSLALSLVIFATTAHSAAPPDMSRMAKAQFYLTGCKDFVAGRSNFYSGRCAGVVEVLDAAGTDAKLSCTPTGTNNLDRVRAVVAYIQASPDRANQDFRLMANEALAKTWPCKK
jgi:hypothetical protein